MVIESSSSSSTLPPWLPSQLRQTSSPTRLALLTSILPPLLDAIADIGKALGAAHRVSPAGTANTFGDEQLNVDVAAERILRAALARCGPAVVAASSEEDPVEKPVVADRHDDAAAAVTVGLDGEEGRFAVAFDPLDGSSIVGSNWTVGTIVGIWQGESALGQNPREKQVAAILGVYGPRTTAIVALREPSSSTTSASSQETPLCFELGLGDDAGGGGGGGVQLIRDTIRLSAPPYKTKYFAPANLRAAAEDPRYMGLVSGYISRRYTLRYSGGLVPDVAHALIKGHGVYVSPVAPASRAKLRRLYELCPVALVVECAGGRAVDPADGRDVLEREVLNCDERGGLVCGNEDEVEAVRALL